MGVQILDSCADLGDVALDFKLMQTLSATKQLVETLVLTQLEQDVNILSILEKMLEAHNVVVMKTPVDLDLRHQFLLGSALSKG